MLQEQDKKTKIDLFADSTSDTESDGEHDLSFYVNNRIKVMKKIFKVMTSKRIVRMAPQCLKNIPLSDMKSLLLDELLGISNKRLTSVIFDKPKEVGSSSSESEHIKPKLLTEDGGIISLDDITDDGSDTGIIDDNCMEIELSERERLEMEFECPGKNLKQKHKKSKHAKKKHKKVHVKMEPVEEIPIKKEVIIESPSKKENVAGPSQEEPVMSALNLLELQARARAIRSQLRSELTKTVEEPDGNSSQVLAETLSGVDSPNSVVVVSPSREVDVVIVNESSHSEIESEKEVKAKKSHTKEKTVKSNKNVKKRKLKGTVKDTSSKKQGNNHKIASTSSSGLYEDPENDNDVLIMNVTQEYDDFDKEFANVPLKLEVTDD